MNNKKIRPEGFYDKQFSRTSKKSGKWRGISVKLYKKYKRTKKVLPIPYIKKVGGVETLIVPYFKTSFISWGKIIYRPKDQELTGWFLWNNL